jgi:dynein light chain LC8-type
MDISKVGSSTIDKSFGRGGQNNKDAVLIVSNLEIHKPVVTFCDMTQVQKEFAFETAETAFSII